MCLCLFALLFRTYLAFTLLVHEEIFNTRRWDGLVLLPLLHWLYCTVLYCNKLYFTLQCVRSHPSVVPSLTSLSHILYLSTLLFYSPYLTLHYFSFPFPCSSFLCFALLFLFCSVLFCSALLCFALLCSALLYFAFLFSSSFCFVLLSFTHLCFSFSWVQYISFY